MARETTPRTGPLTTQSSNHIPAAIAGIVNVYDNEQFVGDAILTGNQWSLRVDNRWAGSHSVQAFSGVRSNTWQFSVTVAQVAPQIASVTGREVLSATRASPPIQR